MDNTDEPNDNEANDDDEYENYSYTKKFKKPKINVGKMKSAVELCMWRTCLPDSYP